MYEQFKLNLFAPIKLAQMVIPGMRERQEGLIVNIGSTSSVHPGGMYPIYSASKSALEALTFGLASNLRRWNIQSVIAIVSATSTSILDYSTKFGSRGSRNVREYEDGIKNAFNHLKTLIYEGSDPLATAKELAELLESSLVMIRVGVTQKAKNILRQHYRDPHGMRFLNEINKKINYL